MDKVIKELREANTRMIQGFKQSGILLTNETPTNTGMAVSSGTVNNNVVNTIVGSSNTISVNIYNNLTNGVPSTPTKQEEGVKPPPPPHDTSSAGGDHGGHKPKTGVIVTPLVLRPTQQVQYRANGLNGYSYHGGTWSPTPHNGVYRYYY